MTPLLSTPLDGLDAAAGVPGAAPAADPLAGHDVRVDAARAQQVHDDVIGELTRAGVLRALRALHAGHGRALAVRSTSFRVGVDDVGLVLDAIPLLVAAVVAAAGSHVTTAPSAGLFGADGIMRLPSSTPTVMDLARHVVPGIVAPHSEGRADVAP